MTSPHTHPAERETPAGEAMREAVAYLSPHPSTKGPVILDPVKMRAAQAVIASELARLAAHAECGHANADENYRRLQAAEAALTSLRAEHAATPPETRQTETRQTETGNRQGGA